MKTPSAACALLATALTLGCAPTPVSAPGSGAEPRASVPLRHVPLGLCEDYPEETRSLEEVRRDFGVLEAAGINVLRVSIGWDGVEPERDRYDFSFWDAFVALARANGIRLIPYVAYTPRWDSDGAPETFWKTPPRDPRAAAPMIGDDNNRHLGVTFADYAPKPAFAALAFTQSLFAPGFTTVDAALRVSRLPSSSFELRAFVTARNELVVVAWLPTATSAAKGAPDEFVRVAAPYLRRGRARVYDAEGRRVTANLREFGANTVDFGLDLPDGAVRVVEQPIERSR